MISVKHFGWFIAVFAIASFLIANASAFGSIQDLEVDGVEVLNTGNTPVAVFAGQTIPVRVEFRANEYAEDVRVKAWISGDREFSVSTDRFDVLEGRTYSRLVSVQVPFDLDENKEEDLQLVVVVESRSNGIADAKNIDLTVERESYIVEILDVELNSEAKAGEILALDIVVKNRGRQFSEDTFVKASIPALGISDRAYFGDLAPVDQGGDVVEKEDAVGGRLYLRLPESVPAGVYNVEIEAVNEDAVAVVTKKVAIAGAGADSKVISPVHSRSSAVGTDAEYSITIVNGGNKVKVYELIMGSSSGLNVEVSEPVVAVPAGTSKTVKIMASAEKAGKYDFAVNVHSEGELVKEEKFTLDTEGSSARATAGNATVLLTVILAIVFVVLLVVLIVLLTRKPEKSEELGESYY